MTDQKFTVPEPPPGIGSGFLTEYWTQQEPLPTLKGGEVVWYFIQRGLQTVLALPMSNTITIMTIAVSLLVLSSFLLTVQNIGRIMTGAGNTFYVTAYIKDGVSEKDLADFTRQLESSSRIRAVEFVSKEKALENFRRDLGSKQGLLEGLEQENPLPASVDIVLHPDELGIDAVNSMIDELRKNKIIDDVVFGNEWVEKIQGVLQLFRFLGAIGLLIVMVIVISLIANTIKLVFYARRDEIAIMQLVGASEWFVKTPFVIGGLLQGTAGSILCLLLLRLGFTLLNYQLQNISILGVVIPELAFLTWPTVFALIALGILIGALGSLFSVGRFMKL